MNFLNVACCSYFAVSDMYFLDKQTSIEGIDAVWCRTFLMNPIARPCMDDTRFFRNESGIVSGRNGDVSQIGAWGTRKAA